MQLSTGPEEVRDNQTPVELESQMVVNYMTWVLGTHLVPPLEQTGLLTAEPCPCTTPFFILHIIETNSRKYSNAFI